MSDTHEIKLLGAGGEYMESATLLEWKVPLGGKVAKGDVIATVETAKAASDVEAPADGVILQQLFQVGDEVSVGATLGILGPPDGSISDARASLEAVRSAAPSDAEARENERNDMVGGKPVRVFATPRARELARQRGIDLGGVTGTGPQGCIKARDLAGANQADTAGRRPAEGRDATPSDGSPAEAVARMPRSERGYQAAMAAQMAKTSAIPQFNVAVDCDGSAIFACRERIKKGGGRPTVNDLIVLTVARVLKQHPAVNAFWQSNEIQQQKSVHIGVAMSTSRGLVVPVVRDADQCSAAQIAATVASLRELADAQRLESRHVSGAGFTISNLGAFGINSFTAIVNPPQVAILAVPAFARQVVLDGDRIVARPMARLILSADHRALDGAAAAAFLRDLKKELEAGDFGI